MTVEACFVLPFFLFAFLNIISIIDIYRLQGSMSAAMHDSAKSMAIKAYAYKDLTHEAVDGEYGFWQSVGITLAFAKSNTQNELGEIYPEEAVWVRSQILGSDDCIDLVAEYPIRPPVGIMGFSKQTVYNRLRTRAWTGYDNAQSSTLMGADEEIVYVAETGTVYHRSRACTYLKLSISTVDFASVKDERNYGGHKYSSCEECGFRASGTVYITNHGQRYHSSLTCSKLKRTVSAVPISQVGGKGACSKCGGS
jgi:hypothetical protein